MPMWQRKKIQTLLWSIEVMSDDSEFSTPCIVVCQYDNEDICRGCFRTLDEISNWALMTEEERKKIMKQLDERAESLF